MPFSSTAMITESLPVSPPPKPLRIALISWNMANKYGGNADAIFAEMKKEGGDNLPDIIVIAGQEEGRDKAKSLGSQVLRIAGNDYVLNKENLYGTFTDGAFGRVSLTVLSRKGTNPTITSETVKRKNKGGIGFILTGEHYQFSVSGMHFDSNEDSLKVNEAKNMVEKLEGLNSEGYVSFDTMMNRSTDVDIMMGDLNHRHVQLDDKTHYDPLGPQFKSSAARYVDGLAYQPIPFVGESEKTLAPNTYDKSKDKLASGRDDGVTGQHCYSEGTLDRMLVSGKLITQTPVTVLESANLGKKNIPLSDHKPIVATVTLSKESKNDFLRTQDWVIRKIENYASQEVIDSLADLKEDNPDDQKHLELVFNYYANVRSLILLAEEFRLTAPKNEKGYRALMGGESSLKARESFEISLANGADKPGLVQKMLIEGNKVFADQNYFSNNPEFTANIHQYIRDASKYVPVSTSQGVISVIKQIQVQIGSVLEDKKPFLTIEPRSPASSSGYILF